ncbi:MAG: glutamate racemase [Bacteroidales bacterium]|nr:glutamate racemase [Bacteroidales bacterium]MBN2819406.1 glutamate racemase [Bacteroidales bacterium]
MDNRPIGIFDSGVGGLTVANAIRQILPGENLIYFGDTSHLPYGDKSPETIQHYSAGITKFLLEQDCKIIVIACNSASANAFETVKGMTGNKAPVLNVIDPVVEYVTKYNEYKHIGVIGTKSTINSNTYADKIHCKDKGYIVSSMATTLFVPMIEEGFIYDDISNAIIRTYLSRHELNGINCLILGCTHYPIIKNQINKFYNFEIDIIDSSKIVANALRELLDKNNLLSGKNESVEHKFFVSDITPAFKIISKMFFEEDVDLKLQNIWD